jgi:bacillithiol system protein YtxJ
MLFKHSLTCPISARAQEQFVGVGGAPRYALAVQYAGDVSEAVAERFGVEHASPQLLVIEKGEVTRTLTHSQITADAVAAQLSR